MLFFFSSLGGAAGEVWQQTALLRLTIAEHRDQKTRVFYTQLPQCQPSSSTPSHTLKLFKQGFYGKESDEKSSLDGRQC